MYLFKQSILTLVALALVSSSAYGALKDFDLSNNQVEMDEFLSGGPQKDGIPALTNPRFIKANEVKYLRDEEQVVGLLINGEPRAYPIRILNWHEIVNDEVGDTPVAVTWCPLTGSTLTFDRRVGKRTLEFGVSGLLYNSNVVMYDRNTDGLWSQLKKGGLTGPMATQRLNLLPSVVTSWKSWREVHPQTLVLSQKTGHLRQYDRDPYGGYHQDNRVMFPLSSTDERLSLKSRVLGLEVGGVLKAYPMDLINSLDFTLNDDIGGVSVTIQKIEEGILVSDQKGEQIPSVIVYWFAWSAFNPQTLVYESTR